MRVAELDVRHPEWRELRPYWAEVDLLYRGGAAIRSHASRFLIERPKEPAKVYQARCRRFSYQNILATVMGWWGSKLFGEAPQIVLGGARDEYLEKFIAEADRCGHSLFALCQQWFVKAALHGSTVILVDLPQTSMPLTLRQQKALGNLDAYLVTFDAAQLINWSADRFGELEWAVIRTEEVRAEFGREAVTRDRWYVFDREKYAVYEAERKEGMDGSREADMVAEGRHALAEQKRVPIHRLVLPEALWLGYRVYPQILDHLNEDNGLGWKLLMSNLAVPVIAGDYEDSPTLSEAAFIKLEKGSTFTWSEPDGKSVQASAERLQALRQEIYRQVYLVSQSRDTSATAAAASAVSKQQDMSPALDVANGFGVVFRDLLRRLLSDVALIRGKAVEVEIRGLRWEEGDALDEIREAEAALDLGIPSLTWSRVVMKRIVARLAPNLDPETKKQIEAEIDASPDPREERRAGFAGSLPIPEGDETA